MRDKMRRAKSEPAEHDENYEKILANICPGVILHHFFLSPFGFTGGSVLMWSYMRDQNTGVES